MDRVGLNLRPILGLKDCHLGIFSQKLREHADMARVQMKNQNESHAAVRGHLGEEMLERFQSARGSADANNERVLLLSRGEVEILGREDFRGFF